jgi:hypothetical protein
MDKLCINVNLKPHDSPTFFIYFNTIGLDQYVPLNLSNDGRHVYLSDKKPPTSFFI